MEDKILGEFFHNAPYGVFIADHAGNFVEINKAACEMSGYTEDELIGTSIFKSIADEDKTEAKKKFEQLKISASVMTTLNYTSKNGVKRACNLIAFKMEKNRYIGFFEDITEQNKLENKIRYETDKEKKYFETANVMFVVLDRQGSVQDINAKGCKVLDCNRAEIIGKNWFDNYLLESHRDEVKDVFEKIVNKEISNVEFFENGIVTSKGEERVISWHNNTIRDEDGEISFVISAGEDITDKKKAEKALVESEEKYKYVFDKSPVGKSLTKPSGELSVNQTFCMMTGYTKQELESKNWE